MIRLRRFGRIPDAAPDPDLGLRAGDCWDGVRLLDLVEQGWNRVWLIDDRGVRRRISEEGLIELLGRA